MSGRPDLNELRNNLDEIDNEILDLFEKRIATCREIGNIKREKGIDVYVPAREEEKLEKVTELAGFESRPYVKDLFRTMMDLSKVHQNKPAFGVLGRTLAHTRTPPVKATAIADDSVACPKVHAAVRHGFPYRTSPRQATSSASRRRSNTTAPFPPTEH